MKIERTFAESRIKEMLYLGVVMLAAIIMLAGVSRRFQDCI